MREKLCDAVDTLAERAESAQDADDARGYAEAVESLVRAADHTGALDWLEADSGGDGASGAPRLSDGARAVLEVALKKIDGMLYVDLSEHAQVKLEQVRGAHDELKRLVVDG